MQKKFYITTPLYYVNGAPHLGHLYTSLICDTIAKHIHMHGKPTWLLTGTDEHGQKIHSSAIAAGTKPQVFCDENSNKFRHLHNAYRIHSDDFIRTTEPRHQKNVTLFWERIKHFIYKGKYSGWYSERDEAFCENTIIKDGNRTTLEGAPVEWLEEECFFFKLSHFRDQLLDIYNKEIIRIIPTSRRNEVVQFLKMDLRDLCLSRRSVSWGIPVPNDSKSTIYVWADALVGYLSSNSHTTSPQDGGTCQNDATQDGAMQDTAGIQANSSQDSRVCQNDATQDTAGIHPPTPDICQTSSQSLPCSDQGESHYYHKEACLWLDKSIWPADLHVIGKDILRFHAIYWPAMLLAAEIKLPTAILAHGWWLVDGQKMSKSLGNVLDPIKLLEQHDPEHVRYFLLKSTAIGADGNFSVQGMRETVNQDLAHNYGNLFSRILKLLKSDKVPAAITKDTLQQDTTAQCDTLFSQAYKLQADDITQDYNIQDRIYSCLKILDATNKFIEQTQPWRLRKTLPNDFAYIVYTCLEVLRVVSIMLHPIIPRISLKALSMLGIHVHEGDISYDMLKVPLEHGSKLGEIITLCNAYDLEAHDTSST